MPPSGYPPQPYPPQGYPAQGYPAQGYPAPGYPAQGYPGQGHPAQPSYGQPQYAGQGYPGYAYPPVRTTSGRATAVMILGIASLVTMCASGLGFIPAIVALCLAPGAKRDIRASNGAIDGETQVKTGVICSWITIGLSILAMVALVIFIIALARDPHPYYRNSY